SMAQREAQALIVAQAGPFTDGAHALLATIPAVAGIAQAHDGAAVRALLGGPVAVVLLDGGLWEEQVQAVVGHILAPVPRTRRLVPAEGVQQQELGVLAGVDAVLLKGASAQDLYAATERLLPER